MFLLETIYFILINGYCSFHNCAKGVSEKKNVSFTVFVGNTKNYPSFSSKRLRKLSFFFLEDARIMRRRYKKIPSSPSSQEIQNFLLLLLRRRPSSATEDTKKKLFSTVFAGNPKIFSISLFQGTRHTRRWYKKKISPTWQEIVFLSKTVKLVYSLFFSFFKGARHHAQRIQRNSFFFTVVAKFSFSHAHRSMTVEGIDFKNIWTDAKPIGSIMKNCLYPIHL